MNTEVALNLSKRRNMVQILYRFFIVNQDEIKIKQSILDDSQFYNLTEENKRDLENLIDFVPSAVILIEQFLDESWKWNRIPNMIRAILCMAIYEMKINKIPAPVIISTSIEMTREYLPSWNEKFVNAILDKISKEL